MLRLVVSVAVLVAFGGMAAGASPAVNEAPPANHPGQTKAASAQPQPTTIRVLAANRIIGRTLRDPDGGDAGTINSLVIDIRTGVVDFVLVRSSGSFNAGNGVIAVPWQALQPPGSDNGPIDTKISADKIQRSPHIAPALIYGLNESPQRARIYGYYGYEFPRYYSNGQGIGLMGGYGRNARFGPGFVGQARGDERAFENRGRPNNAQPNGAQPNGLGNPTTRHPTNTHRADESSAASGGALVVTRDAVVSTLDQHRTTSANALQNASVNAGDGESIGDIDEAMIDVDRGEIAYILLSRGGFLGLNQRWYVLPIEALEPAPYKGGYRLTVDASTLLQEPAFSVDRQNLPTHVSASQLAEMYQRFGMQPYWEQDNQRNAPTPEVSENQGQQSSSPSSNLSGGQR